MKPIRYVGPSAKVVLPNAAPGIDKECSRGTTVEVTDALAEALCIQDSWEPDGWKTAAQQAADTDKKKPAAPKKKPADADTKGDI